MFHRVDYAYGGLIGILHGMLIQSKANSFLVTHQNSKSQQHAGQAQNAPKKIAEYKSSVAPKETQVKFEGFTQPVSKLSKATASYQGQAQIQKLNVPLGQHIDKYI